MVAKNPKAGRAYIYRWRYYQEFCAARRRTTTSRGALELAPDDPEVLFTAAVASERKQDAASARVYFEKGFKLDPKNLAFALAWLAWRPGNDTSIGPRPSCGKAFQANPSFTWPSTWRRP